MIEYEQLAYMDLQKTGSTFVRQFLKQCCTDKLVRLKPHGVAGPNFNPNCYYFITIRDTRALYSSLYRYGLTKKGGFFNKMSKARKLDQYKSFETFVRYCLDEKNAHLFGSEYDEEIGKHIGFMSYRFLRLSLKSPTETIATCIKSGMPLTSLEGDFITNLEIKNEYLNEGIRHLASERFPDLFDQKKVAEYLGKNKQTNKTKVLTSEIDRELSSDTEKLLQKKETLLLSRY